MDKMQRKYITLITWNFEMPETWRCITALAGTLKRAWKSTDVTWIEWTTNYSFCQLSVSTVNFSHSPLTDCWTFSTALMCGATCWILHLAKKIISCLLFAPLPPLLYAVWRGSKDTGSSPAGASMQLCMLGQIRRQNPPQLPCDYLVLLPNLFSVCSWFWAVQVFSRWLQSTVS